MTTMKSQPRTAARRFRWSQTQPWRSVFKEPTSTSIALLILTDRRRNYLNEAPSIPTHVNDRRNQSRCPHAKSPRAAIKSP
jgi:hypothetical protein